MNNKSIQKKKESLFGGEPSTGVYQLLAESGIALMHRGPRATQQAAPAKTYMQNKAETKTKPNEFPR